MAITKWALGDENYKTLQDLEAEYLEKYPGMDTSGGVFSDARHAAATNLMSDKLGGGWIGDTAANIGGFAREVPTLVSETLNLTPRGQSWEDLQANTLAYDYPKGTSAADIYADVFAKYDQSQKAALGDTNYAYGTARADHENWVPKTGGPDFMMATPYLLSKASNLKDSAMHSTPTYDTSDSYLYSTSSGEPVPLPPQLRKPETNWYDGIINALNPSKADVLARLQANNPAFKGDYYTSRQPSGPWDTGEWGPGPKSDLSDPSGDAFDFKFKEDIRDYNTGTGPEWMVGKDPMGKGRLLGEDQFGEVWGTPPKGKLAQGIETLTGKLPSMQLLSNLSQMMPVNERAIMEGNLRNQGIYTDDIGRIVQAGSDYNDPRNVMKDYNAFQMTDKTFDKRTDRIEKTLRDKYNMTDAEIADVYAGSYKGDVTSDLMKRLRNIKTSKNVIMQQKDFAKQMADQRREAKEQAKLNQLSRAQARADRANIQNIQQYTGRPLSNYRMSRPASERQYTGHGKSGMGRDRSKLMAYGGRVGYANGGLASLFTRRG